MRSYNNDQPVHPEVGRSIRLHARKLFLSGRIPGASQEDLEQDLYVAFLSKKQRYDPDRSSYRTFIDRVVVSCAATLVEAAQAQKRGRHYEIVPFSRLARDADEDESPTAEEAVAWYQSRSGLLPSTESDVGVGIDVRGAVAELPRHLRQTCAGLMVGTVSDAARHCGVSRWAVHDRVKAIRASFIAAGLDVYRTSTQHNPGASGK